MSVSIFFFLFGYRIFDRFHPEEIKKKIPIQYGVFSPGGCQICQWSGQQGSLRGANPLPLFAYGSVSEAQGTLVLQLPTKGLFQAQTAALNDISWALPPPEGGGRDSNHAHTRITPPHRATHFWRKYEEHLNNVKTSGLTCGQKCLFNILEMNRSKTSVFFFCCSHQMTTRCSSLNFSTLPPVLSLLSHGFSLFLQSARFSKLEESTVVLGQFMPFF